MIPIRDNINNKSFAVVNWILIAANAYFFTRELRAADPAHLEAFIRQWAIIPSRLWADFPHHWPTLVTAAFLHGGWAHLIGNMLFLFVFGPSVEDRMGHFRYVIFYLAIGVFANAVQAYLMANSSVPLLGASGAIAGVLGAYFFYFPYARILTLIPIFIFIRIVELPAFIFLGLWFIFQAWQGAGAVVSRAMVHNGGGVAWWAHASGFVAGLIVSPALALKKGRSR